MSRLTRIAVVQTDPIFGDPSVNLKRAFDLMGGTAADLYVLPELFTSGYNFSSMKEVESLAEPFRDGGLFKSIKHFCSSQKCTIVYGFAERAGRLIYNSAGLVSHDGTKGLYRKIHLFDREKLFFTPGNLPFQVFQTPVGRIGIMICFDWYFPESARTLARRGAQLIAHPANLVLPHCPESMPVRARENRVFVATANRVGSERRGRTNLKFIGQSQITAPDGRILFRASKGREQVGICRLDLRRADSKTVTSHNNIMNDLRPKFYV